MDSESQVYLFWFGIICTGFAIFRWKEIYQLFSSWKNKIDARQYDSKYNGTELGEQRLQALKAAREKLQEQYNLKFAEEAEKRKEMEEAKKAEKLAQREKLLGINGGQRLGDNSSNPSTSKQSFKPDYNPLGPSDSSARYRPPKRSCCKKGGGCG